MENDFEAFDDLESDDLDIETKEPREKPDLATVLDALTHYDSQAFNTVIFYGLSDLSVEEFAAISAAWWALSGESRARLLNDMNDISEVNVDLDYRVIGQTSLDDLDSSVRVAAIDLLWVDDSLPLMQRLIDMAQWDESAEVRAAAVSALGRFILAGELDILPEVETNKAQDAAINLLMNDGESVEVRRRALEAISNSSHEIVADAIQEAYESSDERMRVSAVYAMGRSCDPRWTEEVVREMDSENPEMRFEAVRACGELEIRTAVPLLLRRAHENDREIKEMAIWSLGEIGGQHALQALTRLAEEAQDADDALLLESIEEAIGAASLVGGDLDIELED